MVGDFPPPLSVIAGKSKCEPLPSPPTRNERPRGWRSIGQKCPLNFYDLVLASRISNTVVVRKNEEEDDEGIQVENLSSASISNTPMIGTESGGEGGVARRIIRNARRRMACPLEDPLSFYSIVRRSNVVEGGPGRARIPGLLRKSGECLGAASVAVHTRLAIGLSSCLYAAVREWTRIPDESRVINSCVGRHGFSRAAPGGIHDNIVVEHVSPSPSPFA